MPTTLGPICLVVITIGIKSGEMAGASPNMLVGGTAYPEVDRPTFKVCFYMVYILD